ncbi:MAG: DUF262 domain-containing protein [Prevotellaceae bacterium]|jgi:hypothetical protein|nr:DUF262 domain-containing protein [Prevotellaceae bacterium]
MQKEYTFADLFTNSDDARIDGITIPMIQRDYAQGRETEKETTVRSRFLDAIFKTLVSEDSSAHLKMDFIYGSTQIVKTTDDQGNSIEKSVLIPLDGQQRLTTLYLLYWYIGSRELSGNELQEMQKMLLCFSYETRTSAREFCEKLSKLTLKFDTPPKTKIEGAAWFFDTYKQDPTVKAMLGMLDAIHKQYEAAGKKLYNNLARLKFYVLQLDEFKLSDELYVKMNARGKPLTDFENFKADLVGHVKKTFGEVKTKYREREMPYYLAFSIKLDNDWTNFFWEYSKKSKEPVDRFFFNFIKRYVLNLFVAGSEDTVDAIQKNPVFKLFYGKENDDSSVTYGSFDIYADLLNTRESIECLEIVLDCLVRNYASFIQKSAKAPWGNKWDFFDKIDNQTQRAILLAITLFIEKNSNKDTEIDHEQFQRWMRVVWNLAENANVTGTESMIGLMRLIKELSGHSDDIYSFLASDDSVKSNVATDQFEEERVKAKLIVSKPAWEHEFINVEKYAFFRGQIYCLLHISAPDGNFTKFDISKFINYRDKAIMLFSDDLEKAPCRFHRVLESLIFANPIDGSNDFAKNKGSRWYYYEDNDNIRKSMIQYNEDDFYYKLIKLLLDRISVSDGDIADQLDAIIAETQFDENELSTYLIHSPHCFAYCKQKLIKWEQKQIYLLKHSRMSHYHAELRTYYLFKEWLEKEPEHLKPFTGTWYCEVPNSSEQPCAVLNGFDYDGITYALDIVYTDSGYELQFFSRDPASNTESKLGKINAEKNLNMMYNKKHKRLIDICATMKDAKARILQICRNLR